jgi:hypothetical protein
MGSSEVRLCDGLKSFLARCVPDLQLNFLALDIKRLDFEIYSDRTDVAFLIDIIHIA